MPKSNYDGTTAQTFQVDATTTTGPRIKNSAGVLQVRNAGDTAAAAVNAAAGTFSGAVAAQAGLNVTGADATIPDTLSLVFGDGGTGVDADLSWNGAAGKWVLETAGVTRMEFTATGAGAIKVADGDGNAFVIEDSAGANFIKIDTAAPDEIELGNAATNPSMTWLGTGAIALASATSVTVPTPTAGTHAVTKAYADAIVSGLSDFKDSAKLATAAALPAVTAAGSGVGKTLTANAVGVLTVDGIATVLNDRLLVKDQAAGADNGVYTVTTEGTAGVAFILTRATDADANAEVTPGLYIFIDQGTANADSAWVLATSGTITLDTTSLSFVQFSGLGQITAGAGLTKTGNTLDVIAGNTSITVNANDIVVNNGLGLSVSSGLNVDYALVGALSTVNGGDAAAAGTANTAARGDHQHAVATAVAVAVGTALSEGSATNLSRADHVHELGVGSIDAANLFVAGVVDAAAIATAAVNAAEVGTGPEVAIRFTVGTATTDSATTVPAGARMVRSRTQITTPYSAGGTLDIGSTVLATRYQTAGTDIDEQTADVYDKFQDTAADNSIVRATVGGAPAAGAATVTVWYATPAA